MTDVLSLSPDGFTEPHTGSHPEEVKRAEHVENASPVRANFEERQQQPTPPKTPAEPNDSKSLLNDAPSKVSPLTTVPIAENGDGTNKHTTDGIEDPEEPKWDGEDVTKEDVGAPEKPKADGNPMGPEKEMESTEVLLKKMQERMSFLEKEMKKHRIVVDPDDDMTESQPDENKDHKGKREPAIPKLQLVEWEEFKHKYATEEEFYAIEVLVGEARYYHQRAEDLKNMKSSQGKPSKTPAELLEKKTGPPSTDVKPTKELPERIRINSRPILSILGQLDAEEEWGTEPMVILRPYKPLVFYERQIREAFQKLEDRWGEAEKLEEAEKLAKAEQAEEAIKDSASDQANDSEAKQPGDADKAASAESPGEDTAPDQSIKATEIADIEEKKPSRSQSKGDPIANGPVDPLPTAMNANEVPPALQLDDEPKDVVSPASPRKDDSKADVDDHPTGEVQAEAGGQPKCNMDKDKPIDSAQKLEESDPNGLTEAKDATKMADEDKSKEEPEDLTDCVEALRDLRCLIEFMDDELQPVVDRLKSEKCQKVYFSDLWHLFKPGDIMYSPLGSKTESEVAVEMTGKIYTKKPNDRIQDVWKIMSTADGRPNLRGKQDTDNNNVGANTRINSFIVVASYIDFNGSKFGALTYQHNIKAYKGERDITSLSFYPLKFAPNQDELKSKWLKRGKAFKEFMTPKHRYHFGRSLTCRPTGLRPFEDDFPKHAENIDSQVVVDFTEGLAANPGWGPTIAITTMMDTLFREFNDHYPVTLWADRTRKKSKQEEPDRHYFDQRIDEKMMESQREKDALTKDVPDKTVAEDGELSDESLMLLPNRVFAFVMKNRKFAILTVDGMRDVKPYRDGFRDLKLPGKHKNMVSSLVHNHFHNKKAELSDREASHDSDIVRGKGKGLIVLLHGAPGTGKTSTAETVAEAYRKPLFPITCGDLGLTAAEVEAELEDKFHLAELWDCVLLLDEADVFLAQRTRTDVKRNSLVSVFLRVLEYFTGILFLTTNRVGSFDEAFKSRIHISLYYPPLSWNQTIAIWEMNMGKLRDKKRRRNEPFKPDEERIYRFARQHFKENYPKNTHWNGRQIRNAFQTATALAEFEAHEAAQKERNNARQGAELMPFEPELRVEHFETVALASSEFDDYLYKVRGKTDSSRALFDQERADQYQSAQKPYPRKAQQPAQAYQGMPPPPLMQQGAPSMQVPQAQRSARSQQQFPRQQQPYVDNRQPYISPTHHDDVLSEEDEDLKYGQPWQEPRNAFSQSDHADDGDMWRREASPQRQQPRNTSAIRRGSYMAYSYGGPRDY